MLAGDAQRLHSPPPSLHWNLDPRSEDVNLNLAVVAVSLVSNRLAGPLVIQVCGG